MSDRMTPADRDSLIALRLMRALDALPVPAGPAQLRARVTRPRDDQRFLVFAAVVLVLLLGTALSIEPVRNAAADYVQRIQRAIFGPPWTGYYIEVGPSAGGGPTTERLLFAAGTLPGVATEPDMEGQTVVVGTWSHDGELLTITNRSSKIYVGDRLGNVREVADLGPGYVEQPRVTWTGPRTLFVAARMTGGRLWVATIDVGTGAVDLRRLETPIFRRDDPQKGFGIPYAWVSPDGRWIALTLSAGGCGEISGLYEIATDRIIDVVDPQGRSAYAAGWLPDGRLVSASCDRRAGRVDIFVTAPGSAPTAPIATLPLTASAPQFAFDNVNDRFLVFSESPTEDRVVPILDPTGRVIRTGRVPRLTATGDFSPLGGWFGTTLSRDGKFLSFRILEQRGDTRIARSGVVNLDTGELAYACDAGCVLLTLR